MEATPTDDPASRFLEHYQDNEKRKTTIFRWAGYFLVVDALLFLVLLICAFVAVWSNPGSWHLFAAPALAGSIGALVAIFLLKSVYSPQQKSEESLPFSPVKELLDNLSGD